jgi:hypothetical protein
MLCLCMNFRFNQLCALNNDRCITFARIDFIIARENSYMCAEKHMTIALTFLPVALLCFLLALIMTRTWLIIIIYEQLKTNVYDTNTVFFNLHWYKRPHISM